jgi:hypothetical protein
MTSFQAVDEQIFTLVADTAVETPGNMIGVDGIVEQAQALGLAREDVMRSLSFLAETHLIAMGNRETYAQLDELGIERWARAHLDYEALQDQLGQAIVAAHGRTSSRILAEKSTAPDIVIRHIIRTWANTNQLTVGRSLMGGGEIIPITGMSETFRRQYTDSD